ncbi:similar to Saccharomyces cerevisiae YCR009C RVS161 Amphiphysin-like lipid raft protein [Maudiozyma saulgeensis]|uniref:Similar to Saccharomyces cerevisiae YCR009C RVS161 Amphiphysin-like lipid raft protein n=1 Tax=Maudiozyma saulgeensis TaxID=1789683 RepID=A0A1X7R935_9SACH|nr:similar to Saccharomyces cerevisiae YCR009C RVS161 Amphiphysin-like lipid raft protein [Kazachstania saulgeensis]
MSWGGFKKAVQRASNTVIIKDIDKINDKDFESEERKYLTLKKNCQQLVTESKGYLDSFRIVSSSQLKIAEVIQNLNNDSNKSQHNANDYYLQTVQDIDSQVMKKLDEPYIETVMNPSLKFERYFKEIDEAVQKRQHKKSDYEAAKAKVRRLTDKPSKDVNKLPTSEKELQLSKEIYESLNNQLKQELPQLIQLRVPFFDASFEALVKIQYRFSTESYTRLSQVQQYIDPQSRNNYMDGTLDRNIENLLNQMKNLDICTLGFAN